MCDATVDACLALPADLTAPATARRFTAAHCCPQHGESLTAKALLLISELVTNAVRHGRPPITLDLQCCGTDGLLAQVGDASPHKPVVRPVSVHALGGRGIALVELLANRWGVQMTTSGKTVWFRLTDTPAEPVSHPLDEPADQVSAPTARHGVDQSSDDPHFAARADELLRKSPLTNTQDVP